MGETQFSIPHQGRASNRPRETERKLGSQKSRTRNLELRMQQRLPEVFLGAVRLLVLTRLYYANRHDSIFLFTTHVLGILRV